MKILVLDNYDSFTYNLVHYLQIFTDEPISVYRTDELKIEKVNEFDKILLSPGPGLPKEAGILLSVIKRYAHTKSILGVCLGHQAIAEAFGGKLKNLKKVYHGVSSTVSVIKPSDKLFNNIPSTFMAGRYHSWIIDNNSLPHCFEITALDEEGSIMAISHKNFNVRGVQFHPESILTEYGKKIIENWLSC